jgi:hypothetical protein
MHRNIQYASHEMEGLGKLIIKVQALTFIFFHLKYAANTKYKINDGDGAAV